MLAARLAVAGMSLAVIALGTLAVWAAIVTQNGAQGLTRAGVQTSGHLRAIQALSLLDTSSDMLEKRIVPSELAKLRRSQIVLHDALDRMEHGGIAEASRIALKSKPLMAQLTPAVDQFLARPPGYDSDGSSGDEERLENIMSDLQMLLNDLDPDPSQLLTTKLESVTATEHTVRSTAFVLIPLGLGGVAACALLLSTYRRRTEAALRASLHTTFHEARTDQLTGLANRRALLEGFEQYRRDGVAFTLVIADLNGFKRYNDTFGHLAGDALLRRLGTALSIACAGGGLAARLGGDEFCVLVPGNVSAAEAHALVEPALRDVGEGFCITASSGTVAVPAEAQHASDALRLADSRMYAAKLGARPDTSHDLTLALTRMLDERHPGLASHGEEVAGLAVACAEMLGLPAEDLRSLERAAELHDVGKVAIPSTILTKAAPLSSDEWEFMRGHTIIGERILNGLLSLEDVALLVRASHERWDGGGYPDGLAGEEIPLGARIVTVADAYCAMTEDRPYTRARSVSSAREEIIACSGTQFDPAVVTAFLATLGLRDARAHANASVAPAPV